MRRDWGDMRPKRRAWLPDGSHEVHRCRMASVWMESVHHLHCPTCDARLVEQAGRYDVMQRRHPVYVGEVTTLTCPAGSPAGGPGSGGRPASLTVGGRLVSWGSTTTAAMPTTVSKAEVLAQARAARGGDLRAARRRLRSYRVTRGGRASSAWASASVIGVRAGGTGGGYAPTMRSAPPAPVAARPGRVLGAPGGMVRRSGGRAGAAPGGERGTTGRGQSNAAEHVGQRDALVAGRAPVTGGSGADGAGRDLRTPDGGAILGLPHAPAGQGLAGDTVIVPVQVVRVAGVLVVDGLGLFLSSEVAAVEVLGVGRAGKAEGQGGRHEDAGGCGAADTHELLL